MKKQINYDEVRQAAESDVRIFIKLVAPYLHLGAVHDELLQWATDVDGSDNKLCLMPRDHLKSKMAAFIAAWWLTKDPTETILYVSSTAALAEKQLGQVKQVLESDIHRKYWPDMIAAEEGKRARWTVAEIIVDHPKRRAEGISDPSVKAIGITGSITGFHASIVVLDDLVTPQNAYTEDGRDKVAALYSQLASIESASSRELVVGTRYHPKDLYNDLIVMKENIFNNETEDEDELDVYDIFQRQVETEGEFLWPRSQRKDGKSFGFDAAILARKKAKYLDKTQFYAQYYNEPNSDEDAAINSSRFQYYDRKFIKNEEGSWYYNTKKLNVYAAIDFAFSLAKAADYTALVVIGIDSEYNYYILEIDRFKTDSVSEYFNHILTAHNKWGFRKIRAEVSVAQKTIVTSLRDLYIKPRGLLITIDEYRPSRADGDKQERISAILEPRYVNQQIWHYKGGNCQLLEDELVLKRPPHDDIKDAVANACEIAIAPKQYMNTQNTNVIKFHSRFGGIT